MARFGYYTRGVVFSLIGLLALKVAIGWGGATEGSRGALRAIGAQPFGQILLGLTAVGLSGYVVWRFAQAVYDPGFEAEGAKKALRRVAFTVSGCFYTLLAFTAAQLALGAKSWSRATKEEWTAWTLTLPMGRWLVGFAAVVVMGVGLHALYRVYVAQFMHLYRTQDMSKAEQRLARRIGRVGLSALGTTLLVIGGLLLLGAVQMNAEWAMGIGGALRVVAALPYGPYLLGLSALGFVAYGLHCFWLGHFREVWPRET